jgi:hypothetical protein
MKIKTADLTGLPLRYAAAVAEGGTGLSYDTVGTWWITIDGKDRALGGGWAQRFAPDIDWSQGGPIIEREDIHLGSERAFKLSADKGRAVQAFLMEGPTKLIAAMRCYVASKLGDEVEVPDELVDPITAYYTDKSRPGQPPGNP